MRTEPSLTFVSEEQACEYVLDTLTATHSLPTDGAVRLDHTPQPAGLAPAVVVLSDAPAAAARTTGSPRRRLRVPAPSADHRRRLRPGRSRRHAHQALRPRQARGERLAYLAHQPAGLGGDRPPVVDEDLKTEQPAV